MGFHFSILASDPAVMSGTETMLAFLKPTIFCWQHPCTASSFGTDLSLPPPPHALLPCCTHGSCSGTKPQAGAFLRGAAGKCNSGTRLQSSLLLPLIFSRQRWGSGGLHLRLPALLGPPCVQQMYWHPILGSPVLAMASTCRKMYFQNTFLSV